MGPREKKWVEELVRDVLKTYQIEIKITASDRLTPLLTALASHRPRIWVAFTERDYSDVQVHQQNALRRFFGIALQKLLCRC